MPERIPQSTVDFVTLNPGLLELYAVTDQLAASLSQFTTCSNECMKGRGNAKPDCCRDKVVSQGEFDLIASAVPPAELYRTAVEHTQSPKSAGWCPFLTAAGECGVHEWRPMECRVVGTIEPAPTSCKPVEKVSAPMHARRVQLREYLYRIRAVVVGNGPRRPLSEWLLEFRMQRDIAAIERRMPK